jgi:hypothetical protein
MASQFRCTSKSVDLLQQVLALSRLYAANLAYYTGKSKILKAAAMTMHCAIEGYKSGMASRRQSPTTSGLEVAPLLIRAA